MTEMEKTMRGNREPRDRGAQFYRDYGDGHSGVITGNGDGYGDGSCGDNGGGGRPKL